MNLGQGTVTGVLTANSGSGAISQAGALTVTGRATLTAGAANDITLAAANDFGQEVRIVSGNNVTLNDINAFAFGNGGTSAISGNLVLTTNGAVTQAQPLTVAGTTSIAAGAANDITLNDSSNSLVGAVRIVSGNNVALNDTSAFAFGNGGASAISGNLVLTTTGAVTQTQPLTVAGTTSITAGSGTNITLAAANDFGGEVRIVRGNNVTLNDVNAFAFGNGGASAISGNLVLTTDGAITQNPAYDLTVAGTTSITAGAVTPANITLTSVGVNDFAGDVRIVRGNNVTISDPDIDDFVFGNGGASVISGNLVLTTGGPVAQTQPLTVAGTTSIDAGLNIITLNNSSNNFAGEVRIVHGHDVTLNTVGAFAFGNGGTSAISGNLILTSAGPVTQTQVVNVDGTTSIAAGAGNDITLGLANDFAGELRIVSGRNVTLNDPDANAVIFGNGGTSTISGNLIITAGGGVAQTQPLAVSGKTSIAVGSTNDIVLNDPANNFADEVRIVSARDVTLNNAGSFAFGNGGTSTISGVLALTSTGAVTQTQPLTVTGTTSITAGAGNNITLGAGNDFGGQVRIVSGNNVTLNDVNSLAFGNGGASAISGNLILTTNGAVTQDQPLAVTGTTSVTAGVANDITLNDLSNNFGGAVSVVSGNNVSFVNANAMVLGLSQVSQNFSVTAGGTITQTGALTVGGAASFDTSANSGIGTVAITAQNPAGTLTVRRFADRR